MKTKFTTDKNKLESTMERVFDAPREMVWKAHITKELLEKWWGPRKYKLTIETLEPRVGGKWKFIHEAEGERHVFFGDFKEIKEPELITWTFNYEPYAGIEIIETITFEDIGDGKTRVFVKSKYPSILALEGMIQSGMQEGANETWDRLEELLTKDGEENG